MTFHDWIDFGLLVTAFLVVLFGNDFFGKRKNTIEKLQKNLSDKIDNNAADAAKARSNLYAELRQQREASEAAHRALAIQVQALSTEVNRDFVRQVEMDGALAGLRSEVAGCRGDVKEVRGIIFAWIGGDRIRRPSE